MSKEGNVECVHWNPETDLPIQAKSKKNRWILLAAVLAVIAVVVGASMALLLSGKEPEEPSTSTTGQAIVTTLPTESGLDATEPGPGQTQQPPLQENDPILARGIEYYNAGNYAQALATLNQALAAQPISGPAYTYRGLSQYQLGNYQAAVQDFTQAMRHMGITAELVTLRGTSYYMQTLYPEAIADLSKGIELNPGSINAYTYRALAYEATGRMDLAAADRAKLGQ